MDILASFGGYREKSTLAIKVAGDFRAPFLARMSHKIRNKRTEIERWCRGHAL